MAEVYVSLFVRRDLLLAGGPWTIVVKTYGQF